MRPTTKKAITVAAAIAGYVLIEAFLLSVSVAWGSRESVFLSSTAIILAAFFWGGPLSATRLLRVVTATIIVLPIGIIAALAAGVVFELNIPEQVSAVLFVLVTIVPATAVFFLSRRFRYRRLNAETEEWLSDRARYGASRVLRRSRLRRWSLWLPPVSILLLLFFWAPIQGFLDRPFHHRIGEVKEYRLSIPLSWTQSPNSSDDFVRLTKFREMDSAAFSFGHRLASLSYVSLISDPGSSHSATSKAIENDRNTIGFRFHQLSTNPAKLTCWEYPSAQRWQDFWEANCINNDATFRAYFYGHVSDLDSFYEIISSAEVPK